MTEEIQQVQQFRKRTFQARGPAHFPQRRPFAPPLLSPIPLPLRRHQNSPGERRTVTCFILR